MRSERDGRYGSIVAVPTVAGWWAGRSDPQRIELYTRWSFYGTIALAPPLALLITGGTTAGRPVATVLFVLGTVAVATVAVLLARAGLTAHLRDQPLPVRLAGGAGLLALTTAGAGAAAFSGIGGEDPALPWSVALPPTAVLIACATAWPARTLTVAGAGTGVLVGGVLLAAGRPPSQVVVLAVLLGVTVTAMVQSFRFTVWVLDVVVQLEQARDTRARLAVAEERLRFARDLHDVMGRNLSAIAVKGQLAQQLLRRGRSEAADEVADISRIAEESLREVRGVVSGYRSATLAGELAGARSVLRAAGITCTVTGDEQGAALPVGVQTALGWVVREAVTNVLRHSRATTCAITLEARADAATLRVVNDGVTDSTEPVDPRWGNGLTGLAERLDAVGGRLTTSRDDGSFVLSTCLPAGVPA